MYRFSAFKPGKATLTFIYGSMTPGSDEIINRVNVQITITKSLTAPTTTPAPTPGPKPPTPGPPTAIEAWLDSSIQSKELELSINQVVTLYLANEEGAQDLAWTLGDPYMDGVLEATTAPASVPGKTLFSFKAVGSGTAMLPFSKNQPSSEGSESFPDLFVTITVPEAPGPVPKPGGVDNKN
uniref:Uncharacterized protein n=1 Tax=Cryptomonas curvata TaxID=233186 RepID=A0A6T7Y8I5_9CRYP|mmetsp:Transcript_30609/g.64036  ORF Transcript_30609/g.64036 Transcript_30609/m.64036 type:complete len:182 (+) Transcript_30609:409-954(+)